MKKSLFYFLIPVPFISVLAVYIVNPSGTASADPRLRVLGYAPFEVPSVSNEPTIKSGSVLVVSSYAYKEELPKINDFVVFFPQNADKPFVKRVVGLPGDSVEIKDGRIVINGNYDIAFRTEEKYRTKNHSITMSPVMVTDRHMFVVGDNWDNSLDSRFFGPVPLSGLVGKVVEVVKK